MIDARGRDVSSNISATPCLAWNVTAGSPSIVPALTAPILRIRTAGAIQELQGPPHRRHGVLIERARERASPASTPALQ